MPNFKCGLIKPPLRLGRGWVITSHCFVMMWLFIHTLPGARVIIKRSAVRGVISLWSKNLYRNPLRSPKTRNMLCGVPWHRKQWLNTTLVLYTSLLRDLLYTVMNVPLTPFKMKLYKNGRQGGYLYPGISTPEQGTWMTFRKIHVLKICEPLLKKNAQIPIAPSTPSVDDYSHLRKTIICWYWMEGLIPYNE